MEAGQIAKRSSRTFERTRLFAVLVLLVLPQAPINLLRTCIRSMKAILNGGLHSRFRLVIAMAVGPGASAIAHHHSQPARARVRVDTPLRHSPRRSSLVGAARRQAGIHHHVSPHSKCSSSTGSRKGDGRRNRLWGRRPAHLGAARRRRADQDPGPCPNHRRAPYRLKAPRRSKKWDSRVRNSRIKTASLCEGREKEASKIFPLLNKHYKVERTTEEK
jgi:hypothetical protein